MRRHIVFCVTSFIKYIFCKIYNISILQYPLYDTITAFMFCAGRKVERSVLKAVENNRDSASIMVVH